MISLAILDVIGPVLPWRNSKTALRLRGTWVKDCVLTFFKFSAMLDDQTSVQAPDSLQDGVPFDHYIVCRNADGSLQELGRGNMGITYLAYDQALEKNFALKVINRKQISSEKARQRFARAARVSCKISHPNVAGIIHLGKKEREMFCVMEYVDGRTLTALLDSEAPHRSLPLRIALGLGAQIAAAATAMHHLDARIVHRDLKPDNIMLLEGNHVMGRIAYTAESGDRQIKVIDTGIAKSFGATRRRQNSRPQSQITLEGEIIGTCTYASPEQCTGSVDLDGRSDLYSLGVILWEMVTGQPLFSGSPAEVSAKHIEQSPPFDLLNKYFPPPVVTLLKGLLAKKPHDRQPQTAEILCQQFDCLLRELPELPAMKFTSKSLVPDLEAIRETISPPTVNGLFAGRYRLERKLGDEPGDGGQLYLAAEGRNFYALKVLSRERVEKDPNFLSTLDAALAITKPPPSPDCTSAVNQGTESGEPVGEGNYLPPVILAHSHLDRIGSSWFYTREYAKGFSFDELLRARGGALRASELFRLLKPLPTALDFAVEKCFPLMEITLHKFFVVPQNTDDFTDSDWISLRSVPIKSWPPFSLKFNPIGFCSPSQPLRSTACEEKNDSESTNAPVVPHFARLFRELLGDQPDGTAPLTAINEEANITLRSARESGAFSKCVDFWNSLSPLIAIAHTRASERSTAREILQLAKGKALALRDEFDVMMDARAKAKAKISEPASFTSRITHIFYGHRPVDKRVLPESIVTKDEYKASAIAAVAYAQAKMGDLDEARLTADTVTLNICRDLALEYLAVKLAKQGKIREAKDAVLAISKNSGPSIKANGLAAIASEQVKNSLEEAKATANTIESETYKIGAWGVIAVAQFAKNDVAGARHTFEQAIAMAKASNALHFEKDWTLGLLAFLQSKTDDLEEAKTTAEKCLDESFKFRAFIGITAAQIRRNDLDGALVTAKAISDKTLKISALLAIATALSKKEDLEGARDMFRQVKLTANALHDHYQVAALCDIALVEICVGEIVGARQTCARVKAICDAREADLLNNQMLKNLVSVQAAIGDFVAAKATVSLITNDFDKAIALSDIVSAQVEGEGFSAAEYWVKSLSEPLASIFCYVSLAETLMGIDRRKKMGEYIYEY